ncbi:MAG: SEL1-like repeat protein [Hyphomicrobiaceae bacterium]|nr:SEL1-like repeat protein [Hyphomicrobiaceae bacterium]
MEFRRHFPALAAILALIATVTIDRAAAETSSWVQRDDEARARAKSTRAADAKPAGELSGPNVSTHGKKSGTPGVAPAARPGGKSTPPSGEDDAYLAFDQGRYLTALKLAQALAEKGDAAAHMLVARIHAEGLGVPANPQLAAQWMKRASDLGDINATFSYGVLLAEGRGVEKNRKVAAEHFEKAARTGHPAANYNLGLLFLRGDGKPENPYRAAQHLTYAAEKGIPEAQYDLASLYQNGVGVQPNALEASKWLKLAAEQGMAAAQFEYAVMLLRGLGLTADEPKAASLLRSAADKNVAGAQNRLAHLYVEGIGVEKSATEAAKWRLIAKASGIETDKVLDELISKLPKAERSKAEAEAAQWREKRGLP